MATDAPVSQSRQSCAGQADFRSLRQDPMAGYPHYLGPPRAKRHRHDYDLHPRIEQRRAGGAGSGRWICYPCCPIGAKRISV